MAVALPTQEQKVFPIPGVQRSLAIIPVIPAPAQHKTAVSISFRERGGFFDLNFVVPTSRLQPTGNRLVLLLAIASKSG
jgi:hypothetical protein